MLIKSLVIKKDYLTTVNEKATLAEALKVLEDSGYRCVPIVDDTGTIFRGNIYKMHIYRHKSQGGDMNLPVTYLLKNATKTIHHSSRYFSTLRTCLILLSLMKIIIFMVFLLTQECLICCQMRGMLKMVHTF